MSEKIAGFREFLRCLYNAEESGTIYGIGVYDIGDIKGHPAMKQAYEIEKNA